MIFSHFARTFLLGLFVVGIASSIGCQGELLPPDADSTEDGRYEEFDSSSPEDGLPSEEESIRAATSTALSVVSLTLIDADTDLPITGFESLTNGAKLNLETLPTQNLNIRANTKPSVVGSVRFGLDGNSRYLIENTAPYALAGDVSEDYTAWTPGIGPHTVTATPYTSTNARGAVGIALSVTFEVTTGQLNEPPAADAGVDQSVSDADGDGVASVVLDGKASIDSDGTIASYVWFEDDSQIASGVSATVPLGIGTHVITLEVTDDGGAAATDEVAITVAAALPAVTSLTLINADTDQPIAGFDPLIDGTTLALAALPTTNLNIRANTVPAVVGSVRFGLDATANFKMENGGPYALAGDVNGNYAAWTPSPGAHTVGATAYSKADGGGTAGKPLSITFTVTSTPPNQAPAVNAGTDQVIVLPSDEVELLGAVTDDGQPSPPGAVSLAWTKVSGPGNVAFSDPSNAVTRAAFDAAGTYELALSANDGQAESTDSVLVTVWPEVGFQVSPAECKRDLTVTGSASTIGGGPLPEGMYTWTFDGTVESGPMATHAERSHVFSTAGVHTVALAVTLAGVAGPIGCKNTQTGLQQAKVAVWPRVSGFVLSRSSQGIGGVEVTASNGGGNVVTDADGRYVVDVPSGWSGDITPVLDGYAFTPPVRSFANVTSDMSDRSFSANRYPVANAGTDQAVEDSDGDGAAQVTLDGRGSSDPDGTIASYVWLENGLQIGAGASVAVSLNVGTHSITLQVTDDGGVTDTVAVAIQVNPVGPAVVSFTLIDAGTDQPVAAYNPLRDGTTLDLAALPAGLNVRANTSPVTVGSVRFGLDGNANYRTESGAPYALAGDVSGDYAAWTPGLGTHTLIATPYSGSTGSGTAGRALMITFTVANQGNQPPVAVAGSDQTVDDTDGNGSESIALDGSGSHDADGTIASYQWLVNGSGISTEASPTVSFSVGIHTVTLRVTDDDGAVGEDTVQITVRNPNPVNQPPVANAQSVSVQADTPKGITLTGSDADNDPLTYAVASAPAHGVLTGTAPNLTYTPTSGYEGADSFAFKVNDGTVDSAPATVGLTVRAVSAWVPPVGIPAPEFGIDEMHTIYAQATFDYGSGAETYRDAGNGPCTHYVDNTHVSATDSSNPYGSPSKPRLTMPTSPPAGSVVEIHGGPYTYGSSTWQWTSNGTAAKPVFYRGADPTDRVRIVGKEIRLTGRYLVLENLDLDNSARPRFVSGTTAEHMSFRNLEFHNHAASSGGAFIVVPPAQDIVIYNNHIHHNGNYQSATENDVHGVNIDGLTERIWVVDNHIHHHGGDSVQIKRGSKSIYIGRNVMHEDRENAIDIKASRDVIISQNTMYGYRPAGTSDGAAIVGGHEGSQLTWILFNDISDSDIGIRVNDQAYPATVYIVGNAIHNIHHHNSNYDPTSLYASGAAVVTWYAHTVHLIHNTIYDADAGFHSAQTDNGKYTIVNNIIANLSQSQTYHIGIERSASASNSVMHHNLLYQASGSVRIKWGGSTFPSLAAFQSGVPGQGAGCVQAEPMFENASTGDFGLRTGSPAIDAGAEAAAYQTFLDLYGLDINADLHGAARPQSGGPDMGACER